MIFNAVCLQYTVNYLKELNECDNVRYLILMKTTAAYNVSVFLKIEKMIKWIFLLFANHVKSS